MPGPSSSAQPETPAAPRPSIHVEFDPANPTVPMISAQVVTPWQLATAAWELEQMARVYREQAIVRAQAGGLVRAASIATVPSMRKG